MKFITRREALRQSGLYLLGTAACAAFPGFGIGCSQGGVDPEKAAALMQDTRNAAVAAIRLTVVYDNVPYRQDLRTDWGFACLVEGLDRTILFDTGRYDDRLMANLSRLQIAPTQIDTLFLSHNHPDHVGGALAVLNARPAIDVALPASFPSGFKNAISKRGGTASACRHPRKITNHCLSTGEMHSWVRSEHALIILTDQGTIVLTGCAHPGVVEIVEQTKALTQRDVLLVAGGFHLLMDSASSVRKKAARLKQLGVRHVAPSHCTGSEAMEILAEAFGDRFIQSGAGRAVTADDLN